jgi:hypothetical protein
VRSLQGLYLTGFNERALAVHPAILKKDEHFRGSSIAAQETFDIMPSEELVVLHKQFVTKVGGREPVEVAKERKEKEGQGSKLEKLREKHKNAYRPWSAEDDARLTELFRDSVSVATLIKEFGRQRGSINSRLIRLGLIEPDL